MNNISLIGRISTEIELKKKEKEYIRFSLAVARPFQKDTTDFIPCVAFSKVAEVITKYMKKGDRIAVNGQLISSNYESKGEKRTAYAVVVNNVDFLEYKKKSETDDKVKGTTSDPKTDTWDNDGFPF